MNFTREPIIETVITPKDGYKLTIRNSKGGSQEEYSVDAIEVVSFGQSMFFRSQERPKPFLLPVSDYEVMETKETRVVLKNAPLEGSIKIGGGKVNKPPKEIEEKPAQLSAPKPHDEHGEDRPRRRKSSSRRRRGEHEAGDSHPSRPHHGENKPPRPPGHHAAAETDKKAPGERLPSEQEAPISTSMFKNLIPPPPGLISEKFQQEKYLYAIKEASVSVEKKEIVLDDQTSPMEEIPKTLEEAKEEIPAKIEPTVSDGRSPRYHSAPREDHDEISTHENHLKH